MGDKRRWNGKLHCIRDRKKGKEAIYGYMKRRRNILY
jgi:hypothetical protein